MEKKLFVIVARTPRSSVTVYSRTYSLVVKISFADSQMKLEDFAEFESIYCLKKLVFLWKFFLGARV